MKHLALVAAMFLGSATSLSAQPLKTVDASFDGLRSSGYMITQVIEIPQNEQPTIWPGDAVAPFFVLILQKGASTATCTMAAVSFINLREKVLQGTNYCSKH